MASPSLRSSDGDNSTEEVEPMDGAAEGWDQTGVKVRLSDNAQARLWVNRGNNRLFDGKDWVNFEYWLAIRL